MRMDAANGWTGYAAAAVAIAVVFAFRWRQMTRMRPLRLERLWIFPTVYALAAVALFYRYPPAGWGWAFCLFALGAGAALGWQRGKLMRITVDPVNHTLNQTASPAAMLFLLLLAAVRFGARGALGEDNALHLSTMAVTDMLMALALGLFTTTRLEMFLRGRRMLAAAAGSSARR